MLPPGEQYVVEGNDVHIPTGPGNLDTDGGPIDDVCTGDGCDVASNAQREVCM